MSKLNIGNRTRVEKLSFILGNKIHTAIFPKIEVNGQMMFILDESAPVHRKEFPDTKEGRKEARKYAKEAVLRFKGGEEQCAKKHA